MLFAKHMNPGRAGSDLIAFLREERPHKLPLFLAACIPPGMLFYMLNNDVADKSTPPPPEVIYFESWPADRSIEESRKAIAERQKLKDEQNRIIRERYKVLGRAMGMDVDAIEKKAEQERLVREKAAENGGDEQ